MADIIQLKKGLDIPMYGSLTDKTAADSRTKMFGIVPEDFHGWKWKLLVQPGDSVGVGTPLLTDKLTGLINIVAPVSGTVKEVRRGERRKIEVITIEADGKMQQADISTDFSTPEATMLTLCRSGLWAMMRQRPYDIVAAPATDFRDIFVTAFDSAPLAPEMISAEMHADLEEGLKVLASLTSGKVYLSLPFGSGITSSAAETVEFRGPHPAGNVGVQIASIRPVNKGERVLALDARTAVRIGRLKSAGKLDMAAEVAVTGPEVKEPMTIDTHIGAAVATLTEGNLKRDAGELRVISGNVLTGIHVIASNGFLRYPWRQITVIEEGDKADEFMGWASMSPKKFSVKHTFPAFLRGLSKPFDFDARIKGGRRAMILSGEYDKVFPFDIYPEYLLKAIMAKDIDKMEKLGIYEVAPEDFALPEFIDTSKLPLQKIVRDGLDYLRAETE